MESGSHLVESFSAALLRLARLPAATLPPRLMDEGLAALRELVPFGAAWWGEVSGGIGGVAPRHWLSGQVNLSPQFAQEWNRIGATDRFALESITRLDTVVTSASFADPIPEVEAFARRHDLFHAMAITRTLPGSGLLQFISLYRGEGEPAFEPVHRTLFAEFSAHLMQRWSARVSELLDSSAPTGDAQALVDGRGELVYLGARLALLLRERFPDWNGTLLPAELAEKTRRLPRQLHLGRRRLSAQARGELMLLSLAPQRRHAALPPRELNVALMYAEGRSHKEIARTTGLSPATVRTYLREVYLRLGVSDKIALGRALGDHRPRRRHG